MRTNAAITWAAAEKVHTFLRKSYAKYYTQTSEGFEDLDARLSNVDEAGDYTEGLGTDWQFADSSTGVNAFTHEFQDDNDQDWNKLQKADGTKLTTTTTPTILAAQQAAFRYVLGSAYKFILKPVADFRATLRPGSKDIVITTGADKTNEANNLVSKVFGTGFLERNRWDVGHRLSDQVMVQAEQSALEVVDFRGNVTEMEPVLDALEWEAWDKVVRFRRLIINEDDYARTGTALNPATPRPMS